nr:secretory protein [Falciphora oryzae]
MIDAGCNNLLLGYFACVCIPGAATPMPDVVSGCRRRYQVVSGDSCDTVASKNGISVADFRRWNKFINSGCTNLWANARACTAA